MRNTAAIILAAGNSSRLGGIKQLLPFNQKTLLQHTLDELTMAGAAPVIVVTGGHAEAVTAAIELREHSTVIYNERWEQGKASGIVAGMQQIRQTITPTTNIILTVCDQPFVSAALFEQLYAMQQSSGKNIVAAAYANTLGTPVLFTPKYVEHLLGLTGDDGAKKILKAFQDDVAPVDFPLGHIDIDTVEDYARLLNGTFDR